jgi:hypothetical protein
VTTLVVVASQRCCFVAHACFFLSVVIVGAHRELHEFIVHRLGSSHTLLLSSPCCIVFMLLPCVIHWWRILCDSLVSYAMASSKLQTTMRKFLFDGPWSVDSSDALGFLSVGLTGAPRVEATTALPAGPCWELRSKGLAIFLVRVVERDFYSRQGIGAGGA